MSIEHIADVLLHFLESHIRARFAFQMIKQPAQRNKLLVTCAFLVGAMIYLAFMVWRIQVHVQSIDGIELAVTDVALPRRTIPCKTVCFVGDFDAWLVLPLDLLVGNGPLGVALSNH